MNTTPPSKVASICFTFSDYQEDLHDLFIVCGGEVPLSLELGPRPSSALHLTRH